MGQRVDFVNVSTRGGVLLSRTPPGCANESATSEQYDVDFVVTPASSTDRVDYVAHILENRRDLVIAAKPLETAEVEVDGIRWTHVFYEDGLAINVLYTLADAGKRAVGFKLSDGMDVPAEARRSPSSRARSPSSPAPSAAPSSSSKAKTDPVDPVLAVPAAAGFGGESGMRLPRRDFVGATAVVTGAAAAWVSDGPRSSATEGADVLVLVDWHAEQAGPGSPRQSATAHRCQGRHARRRP